MRSYVSGTPVSDREKNNIRVVDFVIDHFSSVSFKTTNLFTCLPETEISCNRTLNKQVHKQKREKTKIRWKYSLK